MQKVIIFILCVFLAIALVPSSVTIKDTGITVLDEEGELLIQLNDKDAKNRTATFYGDIMNNDDVNGLSRFVERNFNNGTHAAAAFTAMNDVGERISFGLWSTGATVIPEYGGGFGGIGMVADGLVTFTNYYNQPFTWRINLKDDGTLENTTEIMRLNETGLYIFNITKQEGCIAGFKRYGLGCIQIDEQGNEEPNNANQDCYDTYGGRLPYMSEISLAFNNLNLNNETDGAELISDITPNTNGYPNTWCAIFEAQNSTKIGSITYFECEGIPKDYRCFIPFSGG